MKHREERTQKLSRSMDKYKESAYYFRDHKLVVFNVLLISIFQRFCLFFATYIVYRAFGLHQFSAFEIVTLQATISIAVDMLPLPGGIGASEALFFVNLQANLRPGTGIVRNAFEPRYQLLCVADHQRTGNGLCPYQHNPPGG